MSRIKPLERREAGWFARIIYWLTRRKLGRVVTPVKVYAHHAPVLAGVAAMELSQDSANSVDARLKLLAQADVAMQIGCPF